MILKNYIDKIPLIEVTNDVLKLFKFNDIKDLHPANIPFIKVTNEVLKLLRSNDIKELHL